MNEQHIDALPPVQPTPTAPGALPTSDQPSVAAPAPAGGFVDPAQAAQPLPVPPMPAAPLAESPGTPPIADDLDLIEKEWVVKAKEIVEQTKHDPYQQNQAITQVKADYLKKRYNRELKTGEAS